MLKLINRWDTELFLFLNGLHTDWLDPIMLYGTNKLTWIPLYLVIVYFLIKLEEKQVIYLLILIAFTIVLTDQISASLLKPMIGRLRPCHEGSIQDLVHLVSRCGGKYGFVSSHAANTFGTASFLFFLLRFRVRLIGLIFLWAGFVAYTRIYLGVHYPLDIIFGALLGVITGYGVYRLFKLYREKIQLS
jgi:undecaprenyl-diphosphatase